MAAIEQGRKERGFFGTGIFAADSAPCEEVICQQIPTKSIRSSGRI
jgi:hypothetical protein